MKKILAIFCFLLLVTALSASFMGYARFHAKVEKIYHGSLKHGKVIKVRIRLIAWLKGGGHRRTFGKRMVGKVRTVNLRFRRKSDIRTISVGEIIPVRYRTSSGKQWVKGRSVFYSSRSWRYTGKKIIGSSYRHTGKRIYHKSGVRIHKTYAGVCHVGRRAYKTRYKIFRNRRQLLQFIKTIPKYQIGMGRMPRSRDPLLKRPYINFRKYMLVVVVGPRPTRHKRPRITQVIATGRRTLVKYSMPDRSRRYTMAWPNGVGYYYAAKIRKMNSPVRFVSR